MSLFEPYPKQQAFIDAVFSGLYRILCYGGGKGGGKTVVTLAILILLCKIFPKSIWVVIRDSVPRLTDTTIPSFNKIVPHKFVKSFTSKPYNVVFRNGSQIWFRAEDFTRDKDFDKFKGLEVNGFLLEQIEELQKSLLNACIPAAGRNKIEPMPPPIIMMTTNPTLKWPKETIYKPYIQNNLPKDYFYLPALIQDNFALANDKIYMEFLSNLDEVSYARFVKGDWSAFKVERQFMYGFNEEKNVCKNISFDKGLPVFLSFDFNIDPITCIGAQHSPDKRKIRIIQEFRMRNSDISDLCDMIISELSTKNFNFIVNGDASGASGTALMKNHNYYKVIQRKLKINPNYFNISKANPSIENSRVLSNSLLQRHGDIKISERCEYLINDLKSVETKEDGSIDKKTGTLTHLLDCFRYYLWANHRDFINFDQ